MNEQDQTYLEYYTDKYLPEIYAFGLIAVGSPLIATMGINHLNNRYIAIPYIIFIAIMYILNRREHDAKRRIGTN